MAIERTKGEGEIGAVFRSFLRLGLTSFGGPVAHIGYFRDEFVQRRGWFTDEGFADLVALCQFLPGPSSSQLGYAIGLMRAGWAGGVAGFVAFTLPSALIMLGLALTASAFEGPLAMGVFHGLKIVAVAIVAQAVWGMARMLCPDATRAGIAVAAVVVLAFAPGAIGMGMAILIGALAGWRLCQPLKCAPDHLPPIPISRRFGVAALVVFALLLAVLPLLAPLGQGLAIADAFYRAGALVFGGGHVVLPLLEAATVEPGWVSRDDFLIGYGAAQAMPGPLFSFAAWLGAVMQTPPNGLLGAAVALPMLFLPGLLLVTGALPFWHQLRSRPWAQTGMQGANAAVVGILAAALYDPVFTSAIKGLPDFALAALCFAALMVWRLPSWGVVIMGGAGGALLTLLA